MLVQRTGTFEESLGKIYDLYMERHVNTESVDKFLKTIGFFGEERKRLLQILRDARGHKK